jgi:hypothetical protein
VATKRLDNRGGDLKRRYRPLGVAEAHAVRFVKPGPPHS